jgi:pilus assembly protein CpaE
MTKRNGSIGIAGEDVHCNGITTNSACNTGYPAKVLIIASGRALAEFTSALASEGIESHVVYSAAEIARHLAQYPQWVAVCDVDGPQQRERQLVEALRLSSPVPTLILASAQDLHGLLLEQPPGPDREYAAKPIEADELIHRVKALMLRSGYRATSGPSRDSSPQQPRVQERLGKLIAITRAKGGVGASTIAANLAVGLARTADSRVLLVDADLWYGDIGALLDMPPSDGMVRAADAWTGKEFDRWALDRAPSRHRSGVSVLMRPEEPAAVEQLDPSIVAGAITAYRTLFDFVIVDTAPSLNEFNLQLLDAADQIILVATVDVSALYNTRRLMDIAEQVGYAQKTRLVLNRADTGVATDLAEANLKLRASVSLPSAGRLVVDAANRGTPVLLGDRLHEYVFSRNLTRLVDLVAGRTDLEAETPSKHANLFTRMTGGLALGAQRIAG